MTMKMHLGSLDELGDHICREISIDSIQFVRRNSQVTLDEGTTLSIEVFHGGDHWAVTGKGTPRITTVCDRCLKPAHLELSIDFSVEVPRNSSGKRDDTGNDQQKQDPGTIPEVDYEHIMDLKPRIREELILAVPVKVLCSDECQGLCPVCGQDLNVAECDCDTEFVDPRLDSLAELKKEMLSDSEKQ